MTKKMDYGAVSVLIALDSAPVRRGLAEALRHSGFGQVDHVGTFEALRARLEEKTWDIVVATSELGGEFIGGWIRDLRGGRLAHHAFPLVMIYLSEGGPEQVRAVIDSGPDDILLQPVVPGQLLTRIDILAAHRKLFVVTHDYTGPDRRKEARPGSDQAAQIDVPNPLKLRLDKATPEAMAAAMAAAARQLNALKLQAYAVQLRWTEATLGALLDNPSCDAIALQPHLARLKGLTADLLQRTKSATDSQPPEEIAALANGVQAILRAGPTAGRSRWQPLPPLCAAAAGAIRRVLGT